MPDNRHTGNRKQRGTPSSKREPNLGYYLIITDTQETEKNYMDGLKDSIPSELQGKLVIKVSKAKKTSDLVDEAQNSASLLPQYSEPWIVFDRDQVDGFDSIISEARSKNINVGWSNPCIEIWFSAYFGTMPTYQDSVKCCKGFSDSYKKATGKKYIKSDKKIYSELNKFGDEEKAIIIANQKLKACVECNQDNPSEMCPCTTVHLLINEIKKKIK